MSSRRIKAHDTKQLPLFSSEPVTPNNDLVSNHPRFDQVMSEIDASRKSFATKEG